MSTDADWKEESKIARAAFFETYGQFDNATDDRWLGWLGVWMIAWQECLEAHRDYREETIGIFTDLPTHQTVHIPEGNNILYGQDFSFYRGVPPGEYQLLDNGGHWKLVAPGYGDLTGKGYGNGALAIQKSQPVPWSPSPRANG